MWFIEPERRTIYSNYTNIYCSLNFFLCALFSYFDPSFTFLFLSLFLNSYSLIFFSPLSSFLVLLASHFLLLHDSPLLPFWPYLAKAHLGPQTCLSKIYGIASRPAETTVHAGFLNPIHCTNRSRWHEMCTDLSLLRGCATYSLVTLL